MNIQESKNTFVKIRCPKCKNEQIIFTKSASKVYCTVCGELLATPKGGKADVHAEIIEELQ